jgi:putative ABC transport system ATP-binding protein
VLELLHRLNVEHKKTILMVTHDPHAAEKAKKTIRLEKGVLAGASS